MDMVLPVILWVIGGPVTYLQLKDEWPPFGWKIIIWTIIWPAVVGIVLLYAFSKGVAKMIAGK